MERGQVRAALEKYTRVNQKEVSSPREVAYREELHKKSRSLISTLSAQGRIDQVAEIAILSMSSFPMDDSFYYDAARVLPSIGRNKLNIDLFNDRTSMKEIPWGAVLSVEPLVVCMWYNVEIIDYVVEKVKDRKIYFLLFPGWVVLNPHYFGKIYKKLEAYKGSPNVVFVNLASSQEELEFLKNLGLVAELISHNAFVNSEKFDVEGSTAQEKLYDAVYNATISPYKRHHLARNVKRLACVYYMQSDSAENINYYKRIREILPENSLMNGDYCKDGGYKYMNIEEIVGIYHKSKVGLCLSAEEGPMLASIEYMLCGLPVVSTPNIGGRNEFFNDEYCLTASDNPEAVAQAVVTLGGRSIDPNYIRQKTLEKIQAHREKFETIVKECVGGENKNLGEILDISKRITVDSMKKDQTSIFERLRNSLGMSLLDMLRASKSL